MSRCLLLLPLALCLGLAAQQPDQSPTQLTIYNKDFAVARTTVQVDLHPGTNEVLTTNVTSQLEPDSVVLRDATGHQSLHIVEQNYDAGVVSQGWLLEKYVGKTIDFQTFGTQVIETTTGERRTLPATSVPGRILRAGDSPLIEVGGKLQFQLPGMPLFPIATDGMILKPTLRWQIDAKESARFPAELDYITRGLTWQAAYNVVLPPAAESASFEVADVVGWVSIQNNSGTSFLQAAIQLMAGDVAKIEDQRGRALISSGIYAMNRNAAVTQSVTQENFDDFHLYDLHRTMSLPDRETKQVQFLEAAGVRIQRTYQFDPNENRVPFFYPGYHNDQAGFGASGNTRILIRQEIANTPDNRLGIPLPAGRLRLYRRDSGGLIQFVGEGTITHTPEEQPIQIVSGNAFDLTAARRQTAFHVDNGAHTMDETFEVKLTNRKAQPVTIHVVEKLHRSQNWEITSNTIPFVKKDSATVDFPVNVPPKGEAVITYTAHYTW